MGLHRQTQTPCGFCFVEYYKREDCLAAENFLNGKTLDEKVIKYELDPGFKEGRQYGRGRAGGQVRDDFRDEPEKTRGGYGSFAGNNHEGLRPDNRFPPFHHDTRDTNLAREYHRPARDDRDSHREYGTRKRDNKPLQQHREDNSKRTRRSRDRPLTSNRYQALAPPSRKVDEFGRDILDNDDYNE